MHDYHAILQQLDCYRYITSILETKSSVQVRRQQLTFNQLLSLDSMKLFATVSISSQIELNSDIVSPVKDLNSKGFLDNLVKDIKQLRCILYYGEYSCKPAITQEIYSFIKYSNSY